MTEDNASEAVSEYHPIEYPPRTWHSGPSESELQAKGIAYFRVGRGGVQSITRDLRTGDVYIRCDGGPTLVHARRGWLLLAE